MKHEPWTDSFQRWFVEKIDTIVEKDHEKVRISGVLRHLNEYDFGFDEKTIRRWRSDPRLNTFPDGKKFKDIAISPGFNLISMPDKRALIEKWIETELVIQDHDLSDELVGFVVAMLENSPPEFLMECLANSRH